MEHKEQARNNPTEEELESAELWFNTLPKVSEEDKPRVEKLIRDSLERFREGGTVKDKETDKT